MNDFQVGTSPLAHNPLLFAQALVQALEEGVATLNGNDQLTFCNPAFGQLLGRPADSLVGQSFRDLFPDGLPPDERIDPDFGREVPGAPRGRLSVRVVPVPSPGDGSPGERLVIVKPAPAKPPVADAGSAPPSEEEMADLVAHPFLEKITEALPGVVTVYNVRTGRYTYVGPGVTALLGYDPAEMKAGGLSFFRERIHPQDREAVRQSHDARRDALEDGSPAAPLEYRVRHRDGDWKWLRSTGVVLDRDPEGRVRHVVDGWQDVTESRMEVIELEHTRNVLHEKQRLIGRITDTTPDILYIYDLKAQRNVYANRRLPEVLGFTVEEVQAMRDRFLALFTHADDYPRLLDAMQQLALAADQDVVEVEYRIMDPQGNWHWFYDRATIFTRDPDGSVREVLGSSQDITERKLAQQQLTEREYFIKQVADATPDGLYVYDLQLGRSVYNNRQIYQMLGYSYESFHALGTSTTQTITHPEDLSLRLAHFDRLAHLADGEVAELEYRVRTTGGEWLWVHSRDSVFKRTATGAPWQILGIVQNVTERKKGAQELAYKDHLIGQMLANFPLVLTRLSREGTI
ncbi:MAG TPA: PAS domain-containing protein, partial [Cytophagales bacterium]